MLATETINGDLRINKKFNKYGFTKQLVKTFGRISTINGDQDILTMKWKTLVT